MVSSMTAMTDDGSVLRLGGLDSRLVRTGAVGGLLGGFVLFLVMAGYNAGHDMGFWAILNSCFAAFVFKSARMSPMKTMGTGPSTPGQQLTRGDRTHGGLPGRSGGP